MIRINPLEIILWNFRKSEKDIIRIYDKLAPLMQLGSGADMLNFGLWDKGITQPHRAQERLCDLVSEISEFSSATNVLDVGCGFCSPALRWKQQFEGLEIFCLNINRTQINTPAPKEKLRLVNSTSVLIPFSDKSFDRIVALESAQHFYPLKKFLEESRRMLKHDGMLVMAIPVVNNKKGLFSKLGILNVTWTSQHYPADLVENQIRGAGFEISKIEKIGKAVYEPLADYYIENRKSMKEKFSATYPSFVETLVYKSMLKMKRLSESGIIDYLVIKSHPVLK
ncbi:class I SAM-dependent methyltransferase [Candidatus Nitrosotenuis chungbukensis]|uniref:class I SAM-dependent methyltransferase n=1 Tax=Candidatus Nitrosotenuis chungbukensis TaxID=1353246 RepID=UPI0005B267CF|nr:class I SAM-dependent methyltransferase [Candidatus Nitrosotenuis chungbukensis]WKT57805.1 class I SAM-dependent methyltransferase [Candidatus Nitrosotenuis chungbukensis]